ncbi:hypothetical protein GCM10025868_44610 [Angustibacter aerolatus]|uniref:Uncharacterized protein n=1 Tax=Angustibacter aerolatus TaxID=1162965 RepID=A0ABQ6JRA1_9ACTN|nr:hypothetical protein GCM10025868_44610 [Angustibacter aerolatus]
MTTAWRRSTVTPGSADSEGVLSCAVLALVGLAGAVVVRWTRRPVDGLGRRRPFLAVSVGLSLALAVGGTVPVLQHHRLETRLSAVASALVGAPSEVRCQSLGRQAADLGSDLGSVRSGPDGVPERRTFVERDPCRERRPTSAATAAGRRGTRWSRCTCSPTRRGTWRG